MSTDDDRPGRPVARTSRVSHSMRAQADEEAVREALRQEDELELIRSMDPRQQGDAHAKDFGPLAVDHEDTYRDWSTFGVDLTFRDISGRSWRRDEQGTLFEVASSPTA